MGEYKEEVDSFFRCSKRIEEYNDKIRNGEIDLQAELAVMVELTDLIDKEEQE